MSTIESSATTEAAPYYRFSALVAGLVKMWRASAPALVAIVANALVQGVLMFWNVQSGPSLMFAIALVISGLSVLGLYAVLAAGALHAADGAAGLSSVLAAVRANLGTFSLWVLVQWMLLAILAVIALPLALLVAPLTAFLPLAAMDGQRNALAANFSAIGARWGRWLVTSLVLLIAGPTLYLLTALNTFFIKGTPAAVIFWLVLGVVAWWILTAWALIYRTARAAASS